MQNLINARLDQSLSATDGVTSGVHYLDGPADGNGHIRHRLAPPQPTTSQAFPPSAETVAPVNVAMAAVRTRSNVYAGVRAGVRRDVGHDGVDLACSALACAQDFTASYAATMHRLDSASRNAALEGLGEGCDGARTDPFWSVLRAMLSGYFGGSFGQQGWEPHRGVLGEEGPDMATWMLPNGDYVCDLLVFMTPWDSDEAIWEHACEALEAAAPALGERLAGVRVIAPLARYLSRHYRWDGTWEYLDDSWISLPEAAGAVTSRLI